MTQLPFHYYDVKYLGGGGGGRRQHAGLFRCRDKRVENWSAGKRKEERRWGQEEVRIRMIDQVRCIN